MRAAKYFRQDKIRKIRKTKENFASDFRLQKLHNEFKAQISSLLGVYYSTNTVTWFQAFHMFLQIALVNLRFLCGVASPP